MSTSPDTPVQPKRRAAVRYARQLFLYGDGDGKRVISVQELSKRSGVHEQTIRKRIGEWDKEREETLVSTSEVGLALTLSAEKLKLHNENMSFLEDQLREVKFELENLQDITARLYKLVENLSSDEETRNEAMDIFRTWAGACAKKSVLRASFLALQRQHAALSGIVDLKDIAVVRQKEIAKGQAKIEIRKLDSQPGDGAPRIVAGGVFARPEK